MNARPPIPFAGSAMEIDMTPKVVRDMVAKRGFYIVGDTNAPGFEIPVVSIGGALHTLAAAEQLNPAALPDTVIAVGPFRLQPSNTAGPATDAWAAKAKQMAEDIAQLWGKDRAQFHEKLTAAVLEAMRYGASMPIPEDELQLQADGGDA